MATEQYIVFKLNEGEFGINIMNIREIIPYKESISVPDTPDHIKGIFNHRGSVIPVIDLKKRLNLGSFEEKDASRIIVITLDGRDIGFLVDEASQTIVLEKEDIDEAPDFVDGIDKEYIVGVGKLENDRLLILIDLRKILSLEEVEELNKIV